MTTAAASLAQTAVRPTMPARPIRPTRGDILDALDVELAAIAQTPGIRAAWQGATGAKDAWRTATGPADLDIWCDDAGFAVLDATLSRFHAARIQQADRPGRLRHVSYAIETLQGLAVVDLTRGDLMVGPVLLVPAAHVPAARRGGRRRRPLRPPAAAWTYRRRRAPRPGSGRVESCGPRIPHRLPLQPARPARPSTRPQHRTGPGRRRRPRDTRPRCASRPRRTDPASRQPGRHLDQPAHRPPRRRGGVRTTGCLVVLVGTDGSGKSTVASEIDARLTNAGLRTSTAYLGMARGNLPGVALARKLLGVAPAGDGAPAKPATQAPAAPKPSGSLEHASVRRIAAWYYAAEYLLRWWRDIRPGMKNGGVVIADRYVYDLRESPWPGSTASRVAEFLMPRPDVLVLPDAPDRIIHARKPERTAQEQADQQERFRELVRTAPARTESLTVDTSGLSFDLDPVAPVVSAVVASLHRKH
jgi:thymidylate kinase